MALYIDDAEVEQLAEEVVALMETTVEVAIRTAIVEKIERRKTEYAEEIDSTGRQG
ncbi:type II toxin-antitoxin system VapB family antitoxin [Rhizobium sp. AAP43]|uniref:type II toxin-antitoxin system VapB family antitoxin n=1 Tax=Rhizobium sp. AAP43 TaxID=1523420 RepID=UPI0018D1B43E|nr:type II toxin-antitoxin system VapB family antitoxin [Rhizobium sp. AAP43]